MVKPTTATNKFSFPSLPQAPLYTMALVSADSRIAELLTELHQLIKQTQVKSHSPPLVEGIVGCDTELWRGQG